MKKYLPLLAVVVLILAGAACDLPWEPSPETPVPPTAEETAVTEPPVVETTESVVTEEPTEVTEAPFACPVDTIQSLAFTVEFCLPTAVAGGFSPVMVPENPSNPDMPPWTINPDMIEISLGGYPVVNQYHEPQVFIYPINDYIALDSNIATTLSSLQTLLATQPAEPDAIPFLPIYNAAQMMRAKVEYLTFRNGSGVRFITQYGQAAIPINNLSTLYAFVGLTDDNQYLISATMPVTHPLFDADGMTEPPEGWAVFSENYTTYVDTMESNLLLQPPATFTPDISLLDTMMSSFLIPIDAVP